MKYLFVPRSLIILLAVALLVVLQAPAPSTLAHAEPEQTNPPAESTIENVPTIVEIWFSQEVTADGNEITVVGPDGTNVALGNAQVDLNDATHRHVTVSLKSDLSAGVYTVNWISVSNEDGDKEHGSFTFTLAGDLGTPVASPVASPVATPPSAGTPETNAGTTTESERYRWEVFGVGIAAGALAGLFIYGFWRVVRPRSA